MASLLEMDSKYILNTYKRINFEMAKGEGSYLIDTNGNRYLDMFSGISVNSLGSANAQILERIAQQAAKYIHVSNYFATEPANNLAKLLVENTFASKVFFCNSGAEANETAIKLARKYGKAIHPDKIQILSAINSFHGRTCGAVTLTGQEQYNEPFAPLLPEVKYFVLNDIKSFKSVVSANTCAVFLEIIQGEGGIYETEQDFLDEVVRLSKELNFLIVIDEIQTGLGRTGELFAYERFGFTPDLVTIAKSLGGGIPIGAMLIPEHLEKVLAAGDHGTTFGGNPLACAVGEYIMRVVIEPGFKKQVTEKGVYLLERLNKLKGMYPNIITDVRGRGLMIGIDTAGNFADKIKADAIEQRMLLNTTNKTVVRLLPPLTISVSELDHFLAVFEKIIAAY